MWPPCMDIIQISNTCSHSNWCCWSVCWCSDHLLHKVQRTNCGTYQLGCNFSGNTSTSGLLGEVSHSETGWSQCTICWWVIKQYTHVHMHCYPPWIYRAILPDPAGPTFSSCNWNCSCTSSIFEPVCGANNLNYFSPCFAGCDKGYRNNDRRV